MQRKRIAIYTSSFPPKTGGIAAAHYNLFQMFSAEHDVQAFVFRDFESHVNDDHRVTRGATFPGTRQIGRALLRKLLKQPIRKSFHNCDAIAETAVSVMRMNGRLKKFAPDLIICPDHFLSALALRKPVGAKLAWMARHNYLRFAQQPLCNNVDFDDLHLAHRLERRALKKADYLVSPSEYMVNLYNSMFDRKLPTFIAKNFVQEEVLASVQTSNLRQMLSIPDDVILIYIPSGGSDIKGARYTFEIVRRLASRRRLAAYIPGHIGSTLKYELETLCKAVAIHAPGKVPYGVNLTHVAACDLTVTPTLVENLSNALVESMMLGVPVVAFDTGGNKEIVQENRTGCIVPYADVEALINATDALLDDKQRFIDLRRRCIENASAIVDRGRIEATYNELLDSVRMS
jgi:glycosyltransferase involved in cell wall biosynthesis